MCQLWPELLVKFLLTSVTRGLALVKHAYTGSLVLAFYCVEKKKRKRVLEKCKRREEKIKGTTRKLQKSERGKIEKDRSMHSQLPNVFILALLPHLSLPFSLVDDCT